MAYSSKKVFAEALVGQDGCVYKAALTSSTVDSAAGLGVDTDGNDWVVGTGVFTFSSAGATKATDTGGGLTFNVPASTAKNPALEKQLGTRGAIQFDFKVGQLLRTDIVGSLKTFFQMSSSIQGNSFFTTRFFYTKDNRIYTRMSQDVDGNWLYGPAPTLQARSETTDANHTSYWLTLDTYIPTDADGMATMGISWDGRDIIVSINGTPVIWLVRHEQQAPDFTQFNVFADIICTMRNLLVYDRPFRDPRNSNIRIAHIGHSFIQRIEGMPYQDRSGRVGLDYAHCSVQQLSSQLYGRLPFEFEYRSFSKSGQDLTTINDEFVNGTGYLYKTGGGTYEDTVSRLRPHFVIITGPVIGKGSGFTNIKTGIHTITLTLMNMGAIPIWNLEQENLTTSNDANYQEALAEVQRQQGVNDMGLVDIRSVIGTTDRSYIEYHAGDGADDWHPNNKTALVYADLISAEIERLHDTPPAYSRLGGFSSPNAISSP